MKKTLFISISLAFALILLTAVAHLSSAALTTTVPSLRAVDGSRATTSPIFNTDVFMANTLAASSTSASSTFAGGLTIGTSIKLNGILNCNGTSVLETNALGYITCGADGTGAGGTGIVTLNGLTADPQTFSVANGQNTSIQINSVTDNHQFKLIDSVTPTFLTFNATSTTATSTIYGSLAARNLTVSGYLDIARLVATSTATSTFAGGVSTAGLASSAGLTISGGNVILPNGSINNAELANSTISGISLGGTLGALTALDSTLTFSATYDGSGAVTIGANCVAITGGAGLCDGVDATGGSSDFNYDAFTHVVSGTSATSTEMRFASGFLSTASSTLFGFTNVGNATTTNLLSTGSSTVGSTLNVSGLARLIGGFNSSSTATSTLAGGLSVASIGGLSSASGLTITGGSLNCSGCVPNTSLANSTISGVALGGTLANLTATDSTLTFSGTYTGATARTIGLNLGNANAWTTTSTTTFAGGLSVASIGGLTSGSGLTITGGNINFASGSFNALDGGGLTTTSGALAVGAGTCITVNANDIAVTSNCTDATTLDSVDSGSFLRSDASDSYTSGILTFNSGTTLTMALGSVFSSAITSTSTWTGGLKIKGLETGYIDLSGAFRLGTGSATSTIQYDPDFGGQLTMATTSSAVLLSSANKSVFNASIASSSIDLQKGFNLANKIIPMGTRAHSININTLYCAAWGGTNVAVRLIKSSGAVSNTVTCTTSSTSTPFSINANAFFTVSDPPSLQIVSVSGTVDQLWLNFYATTTPL